MPVTLVEHVRRFTTLNEEQEHRLADFFVSRKAPRRCFLQHAPDICRSLVFVESGLLRMVSTSESGGEKTFQFGLEGWWIADLDSFVRRRPSAFSLQAIETSQVWEIDRDKYDELFEALPTMERYFRQIYQRGFAAAFRRIHMNESLSAAERYHGFMRLHPDFADRVPQYMLASFLGFSPEFLSKIRAGKI